VAVPVVALITDCSLTQVGFRGLFESGSPVEVLHVGMGSRNNLIQLGKKQPTLVVLDTAGNDDVEGVIKALKLSTPSTKIILLSNWDEVDRIRTGFSIGADGIVLKMQPPPVMRAAIEAFAKDQSA
jgi:DNA-binding NarL/FixJ family response regulator